MKKIHGAINNIKFINDTIARSSYIPYIIKVYKLNHLSNYCFLNKSTIARLLIKTI